MNAAGISYLKTPEKLKYILAPIIATSANEQEQFHKIFDNYFKEIQQPIVTQNTPTIRWWTRVPNWIWAALPILLLLTGLSYAGWKLLTPKPEPVRAFFQHEPIVKLGDTLKVKNLSNNADSLYNSACKFRWEVFDDKKDTPKNLLEYIDSQYIELMMPIVELKNSPDKMVRLIAQHQDSIRQDTFEANFQIHCPNPPNFKFATSNETNDLKIGKTYDFAIESVGEDAIGNVEYEWNFGNGKLKKGKKITNSFGQNGVKEIIVKAIIKDSKAYCYSSKKLLISVEQDKAFLAYKSLKEDKILPMASFARGSWLLWGLTGLGMLWYLVKWWKRKAPEQEKTEEGTPSIVSETPDRGPYYIPFQSRNNLVRIDRTMFRFADVLRLRQEGIRQKINIAQTIQSTIENGGFPNLAVTTNSRPTEYLFLIDELARESHQTKLFTYITDFLRDRDVLVEIFYYKKELNRFWNKDNKGGIPLEILQRMHANYRVMIFGNGHDFLDPFAKEKPCLRKNIEQSLKGWKHRSLITPLPVVSWNYREKVLFQQLDIFPANLEGLQVAMQLFEQGKEEEEHPNFDNWKAQFSKNELEIDVNYRKWRRVADFQDYLKNHPKVFLWLSALSVYPNPNWSLTIAIGKALEPFGVEVTYDNLLLLSRIPFLQNELLSPKLRMQFLATLPQDVERAARMAVKEELDAVKDQIQNSHAQVEHQTNSAIQDFVMMPKSADNQIFIKELLAAGFLNKKQMAELELGLKRHFEKEDSAVEQQAKKMQKSIISPAPTSDLETFLEENKAEELPQPRPVFTSDFIKGLALGLLFLFGLLSFLTLNETETLYQLAYQEKPEPSFKNEDDLRENWFVKERIVVDSAVIYNNMGREYSKIYHKYQGGDSKSELEAVLRAQERNRNETVINVSNHLSFENAEKSFKNALRVRKDYLLVKHNLAKLYYNEGVRKYQQAIESPIIVKDTIISFDLKSFKEDITEENRDSFSTNNLEQAFSLFYKSTDVSLDSLLVDGYHGMGLTDYYFGKRLRADSTLQFIEENTEKNFFDTLSTFPHLRSLMATRKLALLSTEEAKAQIIRDSLEVIRRKVRNEGKKKDNEIKKDNPAKETVKQTKKEPLPSDYATARIFGIDGKYGLWDKNETVILKPIYDRIGDFGAIFPDLAEAELNKKMGFINQQGAVVIPIDYEAFKTVEEKGQVKYNLAVFTKNYQEGVIDNKGNIVLEGKYEKVTIQSADLFIVRQNGVRKIVNRDGLSVSDRIAGNDTDYYKEANYVYVEGGTFMMGCTKEQEADCDDDEKPAHKVIINSFYMSKYEVTNKEFVRFLNDKGNQEEGGVKWLQVEISKIEEIKGRFFTKKGYEEYPVVSISWYAATAYARWLSEKTGKQFKLPSEAAWEYAARGGKKSKGYKYAGSNNLGEVAWYDANSGYDTHPIGQKKANELGIFDMSGNVFEWCEDTWHEDYKNAPADGSTWISGNGSFRVLRGGSWRNNAMHCRVSYRYNINPDYRYGNYGFRLAHS